ncbi:MAG: hypothetical protein JXR46_05535 [Calditrichaceae bacterium]|nr:hypothetical protein [Calditrichaceae bacterium]MBN2708488.1 hypothetical protein [Calditrichaceae bacterium]RQV91959.1 MAG: hypothetical protein EH224_16885 [Calditrichota bacterium]
MKKALVLLFVFCWIFSTHAQSFNTIFPEQQQNQFDGGLGMTWIDGQPYTTFTLAPEFAFGKLGVGLFIQLHFSNNDNFKLRKIGWENGAGYWRMFNYIRWGIKGDPLYVRLGSLQASYLGNGFIMGYYSNMADYDNRKLGLIIDFDMGSFGMESMTSNLGRLEIIGGRFYYRPLHTSEMPILSNLEVGATYVTDIDPDVNRDTHDQVQEFGADVTLPIMKNEIFNWAIYTDYAKINKHGDGFAFGMRMGLPNLVGVFGLYAKIEKRIMNKEFLPTYFNAIYELERQLLPPSYYNLQDTRIDDMTKEDYLETVGGKEGIFGELAGHILGKIKLLGSYQYVQNVDNSGLLHLEAKSNDFIPNVLLYYTYDKGGIETFEDVYTLDYRSVAVAEIGYKTYPFLYVTLRYRWNFYYDDETDSYKPQERFEPSVRFIMEF